MSDSIQKGEKRREKIMIFLSTFINENGYAPSIREIGENVGLSSSSTVFTHLTKLKSENKITFAPGLPRTIRVLAENKK